MAVASPSSSSSSIVAPQNYGVFLSFRGLDTRNTIVSHLYNALQRQGISTILGSEEFLREREASEILNVIQSSNLSIIIFSENYADSPWCLDELVQIMKCWETQGQKVVPVFYHLNPSKVRVQSGSYGVAIAKHEKHLDNQAKVPIWRNALRQAAGLSGWVMEKDRPGAPQIEEIVEAISRKLEHLYSSNELEGQVGIHDNAQQQIAADWTFILTNFVLEILVLTFDQLSSPHKPHFALAVMILSLAAMLACFAELFYKGKKRGRRFLLHSPSSNEEPCCNYIDYFSFVSAVCQFIFSVVEYSYMRRGKESPIKASFTSIIFLASFTVSKYYENRRETPGLPVRQPLQDGLHSQSIQGIRHRNPQIREDFDAVNT